ncbi:vacuolar protein sorting-associated protein 4-like isoform X1 [Haliotis rufescens]|uniref:vacuolar protein sorting-associated protein 4-like isoform X1 n=1 Tax=Haliotis rufescens TaxID=6454 RepID=UPI00201EE908|nr:vacuolar protein sorting-associated protein 4-like isoform X1 [Haliotis rufescens]XP_046326726.2 vacuolar protein sorting-associated protein 4-like isoform X1 [Haliotis rufescens]
MEEISFYTDAIACLKQTLREGDKDSNVDIQLMLRNIQRCQTSVEKLKHNQEDQFFKSALEKLGRSLCSQADILERKITQLNTNLCGNLLPPSRHQPLTAATTTTGTFPEVSEPGGSEGQTSQKRERRSAIEDTILNSRNIKFCDVAGLAEAKQALTEAIIMPLHYPKLFTGGRKPWKRILLFGPPGTGKSRLAQAVAAEINSTFYSVSSADLISSWVGESEKLIKELFCHATSQPGRSVIFIDEIDSICRQRSSREEEHTRRVKTELLKQMEGADNSGTSDKIFLLCATNCPWELDSAFLRRFQKRIYIPLPENAARLQLIKLHSKDTRMNLSEEDWGMLVDKTEGYSGSDIATFTLGALFEPVRDLQASLHWRQLANGQLAPCNSSFPGALSFTLSDIPPDQIVPRDINLSDFLKALQAHRRTVTDEELEKFHKFTQHFGETG